MRRLGLAGLALVVLAVVYVAAWRVGPTTPKPAAAPSAVNATVTAVTRSCPPPAPNTGSAHIAMLAMPATTAAKTGQAPTGSVALSAVRRGRPRRGGPRQARLDRSLVGQETDQDKHQDK